MTAGPSSRVEVSGGTSVADTASLVVASGSQQGSSSPATEKRKGNKRSVRQGKSCWRYCN